MKSIASLTAILLVFCTVNVYADVVSAQKLADKYAIIAKTVDTHYEGLSAEKGKAFFNREITIKGKQIACASCHTSNPAGEGKHIVTGKPIKPLSPNVNANRFADLEKVEKNFTKHCNDIVSRDCTAEEKGNYITYLISVK